MIDRDSHIDPQPGDIVRGKSGVLRTVIRIDGANFRHYVSSAPSPRRWAVRVARLVAALSICVIGQHECWAESQIVLRDISFVHEDCISGAAGGVSFGPGPISPTKLPNKRSLMQDLAGIKSVARGASQNGRNKLDQARGRCYFIPRNPEDIANLCLIAREDKLADALMRSSFGLLHYRRKMEAWVRFWSGNRWNRHGSIKPNISSRIISNIFDSEEDNYRNGPIGSMRQWSGYNNLYFDPGTLRGYQLLLADLGSFDSLLMHSSVGDQSVLQKEKTHSGHGYGDGTKKDRSDKGPQGPIRHILLGLYVLLASLVGAGGFYFLLKAIEDFFRIPDPKAALIKFSMSFAAFAGGIGILIALLVSRIN